MRVNCGSLHPNPAAVSPAGAQGVAQFMPKTAAWRGLTNPFDPIEAITKSAELLRDLRTQFGNLVTAAAYNAGPGAVEKYKGVPPFRETLDYINRIDKERRKNEKQDSLTKRDAGVNPR